MSLADSTSALAEMIFPFANLCSVAADDNACYRSAVNWMSFIYILSMTTPQSLT